MGVEQLLPTANTEAAWFRRIAMGDRGAFEELYQACHGRVYRYLLGVIGDAAMAEEVADDVLFEVWKGAATYRGLSKPSTWIFGIAHHKALNAMRGRRPALVEVTAMTQVPDPNEGPERSAAREALRRNLAKALEALSPEHREVIQLTFRQGLSYQEIAEIAKCPVNTVKTRMFHAKMRLHGILRSMGVTGEWA
jgi:RNA polymerase sigma-70 factor (ECF subfamily)